MHGWSDTIKQCKKEAQPYFNYRSDLTFFHGLIKSIERIVVPVHLRTNILKKIHGVHQGQEKYKHQVRVLVFGLGINKHIDSEVQDCNLCMTDIDAQPKQSLISHQIPTRP